VKRRKHGLREFEPVSRVVRRDADNGVEPAGLLGFRRNPVPINMPFPFNAAS